MAHTKLNKGCLTIVIALILILLFLFWLFNPRTPRVTPEISTKAIPESKTAPIEISPGKGAPLSPEEPLGNSLVALWHFDGDTRDANFYNNHGTPHGAPTYVAGVIGQAIKLDGIDDYIEVADAPSLNPKEAMTIQAWILPVDFRGVGNNAIIDKGFTSHVAPHYQYHLGITGPQYRTAQFGFWASIQKISEQTSTELPQAQDYWKPGLWYHVVGMYDGNEVRLYVNGKLIHTNPATGPVDDFGQKLMIGSFSNLPQAVLPATLDELAIWKRALSEKEIQLLYERGMQD